MISFALSIALGLVSIVPVGAWLLYTVYLVYVHHKFSHLPSPPRPSFYFGHAPDITRLRKKSGNPELSLAKLCEYWMNAANSKNMVVFLFHNPRLFTADPEVIKAVSKDVKNGKCKSFHKAFFNLYGERLLGNGLFNIPNYEEWKPRRKVHDQAFTKSFLRNLVPKFNRLTNDCLEKLKPFADGKTVISMRGHIQGFVMSIVSKTVFDADMHEKCEESLNITIPPRFPTAFSYIVTKVSEGCDKALTSFYPPLMKYLHPVEAKGYQEAAKAMRKVGKECILTRIKDTQSGKANHKDVLSQIVQLGSSTDINSMEELIDDFCTYFGAGFESTVNLLHFAVIMIYQHPAVLARMTEEIDEVLGTRCTVTAEDLDNLTYVENVLNETLRMYPVALGAVKSLHSDLVIGDKVCPANTTILLMSSVINNMPEYYECPEVFNPERFATTPSPHIFFPFGVGHRICIGKHFALMEAKVFLTRLIQTFTIILPDDYVLTPIQKVTLRPKDDLPCTIHKNSPEA